MNHVDNSDALDTFLCSERVKLSRRYVSHNQQSYATVVTLFDETATVKGLNMFYRNLLPMAAPYLLDCPAPMFTDEEIRFNNYTDEYIYRTRTMNFIEHFQEHGEFLAPHVMLQVTDEGKLDPFHYHQREDVIGVTMLVSDVLDREFDHLIIEPEVDAL